MDLHGDGWAWGASRRPSPPAGGTGPAPPDPLAVRGPGPGPPPHENTLFCRERSRKSNRSWPQKGSPPDVPGRPQDLGVDGLLVRASKRAATSGVAARAPTAAASSPAAVAQRPASPGRRCRVPRPSGPHNVPRQRQRRAGSVSAAAMIHFDTGSPDAAPNFGWKLIGRPR